jgi:hypothetical protein
VGGEETVEGGGGVCRIEYRDGKKLNLHGHQPRDFCLAPIIIRRPLHSAPGRVAGRAPEVAGPTTVPGYVSLDC